MSIKTFQQISIDLALSADLDEEQVQQHSLYNSLNAIERKYLQELSLNQLKELKSTAYQANYSQLARFLPAKVQSLLGSETVNRLLDAYLIQERLPNFYPRSHLLRHLLSFVQTYAQQQELIIPHLKDVLNYEVCTLELAFFALPSETSYGSGPQLAASAGTVRLGEYFPQVLLHLHQNLSVLHISEQSRYMFLVSCGIKGIRLEKLSAIRYACLELCNGERSWYDISKRVQTSHFADAYESPEQLTSWYHELLKQGILVQASF